MLSALRLGQEIEYEYQYKRGRVERHVGRIQQITSRHIAVQCPRYPDSIPILDLLSGAAKITSPEIDFEGVQMRNRTQEIEAEAERQEVKDKIEAVQEQEVEKVEAARKPEEPKRVVIPRRQYDRKDWTVIGAKAQEMKAAGLKLTHIAQELGVEYGALWAWLKKNGQEKKPAADVCPAGKVEVIIDVETGDVISEEVHNTLGEDIAVTEKYEPAAIPVIAVAGDYQRRIFERFHQQREKGIAKYGQPLEDNPAGRQERLEHLAQELTDGLMYIEWLKAEPNPLFNIPDVNWQAHGWTLPGQIKKILEEVGEVSEAIANRDPMNIIRESLDTIQTCKTMISMVLAAEPDISFQQLLAEHAEKLERKGYV